VSLLSNKSEVREFSLPIQIALLLFGMALVVFTIRLWQLQVLNGEEYRIAATQLFTQKRPRAAPRGMVVDTAGKRLADNRASYDLKVTLADVGKDPGFDALAERLSNYIEMTPEEIHAALAKAKKKRGFSSYKPALIKEDLSWPEVTKLETFKAELPGVELDIGIKRTYLYGDLFAHQVGYLGEVGEKELANLQKKYASKYGEDYYQLGHQWGKYGVEQKFEEMLKGRDGQRILAKDRLGRELSMEDAGKFLEDFGALMQGTAEVPGNNVRLSIDLGLQQHIAAKFGDQSGAVVVLDVHTGLVRAMFNHPTFDPEIFARGISQVEWDALSKHPDHPLEDKAIRGIYPPGSTYKLFTAAAGLGEGVIDAKTTFTCTGSLRFAGQERRCWNKRGHGVTNLHKAIQQSCDVYFYNVGIKLGVDRLAKYAKSFGLGSATGIGLNNEKGGLIPTSEWKRIARREEWQEGETLSVAIGQGFDLVTPLQLAVAYAALANGGKVLEPHLVEQVVAPDGKVVWEQAPRVRQEALLKPEHAKLLQDGLYAVVNEQGGTAYWTGRIDEVHLSGKTGTSQVFRQDERFAKGQEIPYELRDHALFAAYVPAEDPELAIAVIVEHGEHGSSTAAPIAKAAAEYWFRNDIAAKRAEKADRKPVVIAPTPAAAATPVAAGTSAPEPGDTPPEALSTPVPPDEADAPIATPEPIVVPEGEILH
jgi:penicillin-binding protein 2